jgi:hypothetical protein
MIFVDLSSAFDSAHKLDIIDQCIYLEVQGNLLAWVNDFLTNRSFSVRWEGSNVEPSKAAASVHSISYC